MSDLVKIPERKITVRSWEVAQDLIVGRPDLSFKQISALTGLSEELLKYKAKRAGWLNLRDKTEVERANTSMDAVIKDVAAQINDFHEHTMAMTESIQRAYYIEIYRDNLGHLHYRNSKDWPDLPIDFDSKEPEEQERILNLIEPRRLQMFMTDVQAILNMKANNLNFVTKMIKNSLPKVDPVTLDLSRRDADGISDKDSADSLPDVAESTEVEEATNSTLSSVDRAAILKDKLQDLIQRSKEKSNEQPDRERT